MLKYNEEKERQSVKGALALRPEINKIVDQVCQDGYKNILWLGIGGTWASCLQVEVRMKEKSSLNFFCENAAEYLATGNKKVGPGTICIISSVTGTTQEMVDGVKAVKEAGAKVLGFIDKADAELAKDVDWCISYPVNEQLKFFMVADRFMYNNGEFPEYEDMYQNFEAYLPDALVSVAKQADSFAQKFVDEHSDDPLHYFVGAGSLWGGIYSYGMCFWEEMHWRKTKTVRSPEFFHGFLEIVEKDSNVTVFVGEDSQRCLSERVAKFLPRICGRYTIIDTKDYDLPGIKPEYRYAVNHQVMRTITNRIDAHMEKKNCHPMEIRRYYRRVEY